MLSLDGRELSDPKFWNERYAKSDGDKPTHEWLRDFDALESFPRETFVDFKRDGEHTAKNSASR